MAATSKSGIAPNWPEDVAEGCVRLDPGAVLRATARSFVLRVRGDAMAGAGIREGDIAVGEFTPEARPGAVVAALIDGESVLRRLVMHRGRPHLVTENAGRREAVPLAEVVIQGVVHTVVRRMENSPQRHRDTEKNAECRNPNDQ